MGRDRPVTGQNRSVHKKPSPRRLSREPQTREGGDVRSLKRTHHRVFEKTGAEPLALPGDRNRKTSKQHDRHGMPGQALRQTLGRVVIFNLTYDKRVIADDLLIQQGDIGLRSPRLLVLQCVTDQAIKSFTTAVKRVDGVTKYELLNPGRGHLDAAVFEDAWFREELGKARGRARRSGKGRLEGFPLFGGQPETLTIRQGLLARARALSRTNSLTDLCAATAAICDARFAEGVSRRSSFSVPGFSVLHFRSRLSVQDHSTCARQCHDR